MTDVQVEIFTSRFQLARGLERGYHIVEFGEGEVGLYLSRFSNNFGTPLAIRGPREAVESLIRQYTEHPGFRPELM